MITMSSSYERDRWPHADGGTHETVAQAVRDVRGKRGGNAQAEQPPRSTGTRIPRRAASSTPSNSHR